MNEVKLLSAILAVLLAAAYMSWTHEDDGKGGDEKVAVLSASPAEIESLKFVTRTQTVSMSFRKSDVGRYPWFEIKTKSSTRTFTGNAKVEDKLLKKFAPFSALRSLGKGLSNAELKELKLDRPTRKLTVGLKSGPKVYELGGRTYGNRDHYMRADGGKEVFLIANKTLSDIEFPEGTYMQRRLREVKLEDVASVTINAGGKLKKILRKNRLSAKDAFWADEDAPDAVSETLGNYLDKVEKLTVSRYESPGEPFERGDVIVEIRWHAEGGKVLEHLTLSKGKRKDRDIYLGKSRLTHVDTELNRSTASQVERDLSVVFPK